MTRKFVKRSIFFWLQKKKKKKIPGQQTKILQATQCSQENKKLGGKTTRKFKKQNLNLLCLSHYLCIVYIVFTVIYVAFTLYIILYRNFLCGSVRKESACTSQIQSLDWEDPLEKKMATHSSILAWKISRTEEPDGLQSMGSKSWARLST